MLAYRRLALLHGNQTFFAVLLSPVLDGFDQLLLSFLHCPLSKQCMQSINTATSESSEKNSGAVIRIRAGWAGSKYATRGSLVHSIKR